MHETHPEKGRGKVTSPPVMFGLFVCISIPVAGLPFHCSCISTWQQKLCDQWKHSQFWPYSDWLKWCSLRNCVNQPKGLIINHVSYCNQPGPLLSVLRFILFLSLWWKKTKLNFFLPCSSLSCSGGSNWWSGRWVESMLSFCHKFISKVLYSEHIFKLCFEYPIVNTKIMNSEVKLAISTDDLRKSRCHYQWHHIFITLKWVTISIYI